MSNRGRKRVYTPPIPWDRLAAMQFAMVDLIHRDKPLSDEIANEISEALAIISREFQSQIRPRGPPRNEDNWRIATLARYLVLSGLTSSDEDAINIALDTCRTRRPQDDDVPIAEIYNKLAAGLDRGRPSAPRGSDSCALIRSEHPPAHVRVEILLLPQKLRVTGPTLKQIRVALGQDCSRAQLQRDVRLNRDWRTDQRPAVDAWLSCYHLSVRAR
jgi:hypothetical protein